VTSMPASSDHDLEFEMLDIISHRVDLADDLVRRSTGEANAVEELILGDAIAVGGGRRSAV
jgi:hypothetical protein